MNYGKERFDWYIKVHAGYELVDWWQGVVYDKGGIDWSVYDKGGIGWSVCYKGDVDWSVYDKEVVNWLTDDDEEDIESSIDD